ncbi:MAG: hypothetical protein ACFFBP_13325 [Promethearchaeota archaeon]
MLYISDYDIFVAPLRSMIITLQLIVSISSIFIAFISGYYIKKKNPNIKRSYLFGIPVFFLFFGIMRCILIFHDFYASDDISMPLYLIANIFLIMAFISFNYTIESNIYTKSKYIFTIIGIILLILFIISTLASWTLFRRILINIIIIVQILPPFTIYFNVAWKGSGVSKKRAEFIIIGIIFLYLSSILGILDLLNLLDLISTTFLAQPLLLIGLVSLGYGLIIV